MSSTELPSTISSRKKVSFSDCDPFGHLNNVNYIKYFLDERDIQVASEYEDFSFFKHFKESGNTWVVLKNEILYKEAASVDEEVIIESRIIRLGSRSMRVEFVMYDASKNKIKSVMWSDFVYFNIKSGKPVAYNIDFYEFLRKLLENVEASRIEIRYNELFEASNSVMSN